MNTAISTCDAKSSLEKAFYIFEAQSKRLEESYAKLQEKLVETQLDLADKNVELRAEIKEREAVQNKLSSILESIDDAVFYRDSLGEIDTANKAAVELLKVMNISSLLDSSDGRLLELIKGDKCVKNRIIELSVDDEIKSYMISVTSIQGEKELSGGNVILLKNITEQVRLQERANRQDRLSGLGRVAASVAHEIRNPLGAIEGFAVLLKRDLKGDPNALRLVDKTIYATRQLNSVVGNLLNYTRELTPQFVLSDFNALIKEGVEFIQPMATGRHVNVDVDYCDEPLLCKIDSIQVKQVIINLLTNGIEACATEENPSLRVKSFITDDMCCFEVADNGEGVAAKYKKKIFEPFFTMKDGGIGLGLALSMRIIETHDGVLYECGAEKSGAKFVVKLKREKEVKR